MSVLILGGGLAGLSAAMHLPERTEALLLERESRVGGLLRTDRHEGFLFDHGPHLFFHTDPYFIEVFGKALGPDGFLMKPAKTGQWSCDKLIEFPYALHLKGLPAEVVAKCVADFSVRQVEVAKGGSFRPRNYEEHCRHYFGDGFTDFFMIPYAVKIWTVHPRELSTEWVGERIVLPPLNEVIRGSLLERSFAGNYIKQFRYPKAGGTESFVEGVARQIGPAVRIEPDSEVVEINLGARSVRLKNGRTHRYEFAISSLPLPELGRLVTDLPPRVKEAIERLDWFGVLLLNYGSDRIAPNGYQWIYFDRQDSVFHRIHYPSKLADSMALKGYSSLQAEISFSKHRALPGSPDTLMERVWKELGKTGFVSEGAAPRVEATRKIEYAYAIMDHHRQQAVGEIRSFLESKDFIPCGRFGEWDYIWTDKVLQSGRRAAAQVAARLQETVRG